LKEIRNSKSDHSPFSRGWVAQPFNKGCGEIRNPAPLLEQKWGWINEIPNSNVPNSKRLGFRISHPLPILPLPLGGGGYRWGREISNPCQTITVK